MAEPVRTEVLHAVAARSVTLTPLPPRARLILRGRAAALAAAGAALGTELPATCRAVAFSDGAMLWLGPDEFLLLAAPEAGDALAARLAAALDGLPHALTDIGHRQVAIAVTGPAAADILAAGCPLDLDPAAFPVGMATRTVLGKSEIVLWRTGPEAFHVEVWRSFAAYAWGLLEQARRDWTQPDPQA